MMWEYLKKFEIYLMTKHIDGKLLSLTGRRVAMQIKWILKKFENEYMNAEQC